MYKKATLLTISLVLAVIQLQAQRNWQKITSPKAAEMQANFKNSPSEYAETLTYGLEGPLTRESVITDLDAIQKQGIRVVTIEAGYKMKVPYLSEGWFENVKIIVEELKKRNMRLWIIDEGKYPSGFAGGKFSQEAPELRMQGLVLAGRINLKEGESVSRKLDPSIVSAVAVNQLAKINEPIDISLGNLNWTAKQGDWQILLAQHRFKTSVTRAANNPTGGKDTVNSLCDYLNPVATRKFLEFTHEQYKKHIGSEFGKTVLGFRGDEPDYGFTPWTTGMVDIFKQRKGYDIRPYLASFFTPLTNEKQKLAKADYWDVWSDLFSENFFKIQADWCEANGLEYMTHLNHEEKLMDLAKSEGDFFKNMRHVQIPGVDAIWNQIWPGTIADFSKLASSAAHMYGRPRALSETFAAYNPKPTIKEARWVVNQQLVRGINLFEFMFWPSSASGRPATPGGYLGDSGFPELAGYSNRASYLLSNGKPAASIALYCPTENMWMGFDEANKNTWKLAQQLLESQLDFDLVDQQGISLVFKLEKGAFVNLSGQRYTTILVPSTILLPGAVLARLEAFSKQGGKVIFSGQLPAKQVGKSFLTAEAIANLDWIGAKPSGELDFSTLKKISDVQFTQTAPEVKYLHRTWQDAELYFFVNEGLEKKSLTASLSGMGKAEIWDAGTGEISSLKTDPSKNGRMVVPLELDGYGSRFIVIRK